MAAKKLKASNITKNHNYQKIVSEMDKDLADEAAIIANQKHRAQKILRGLHKIRAKRLQELSTLLREKLLAEEKQKKIAKKYHKKQVQMRYKIRLKRWLRMLKRQKRTLTRARREHLQTTKKLNELRRKMHARNKRMKYARSYAKRMRELFESWRQVLKQLQLRRLQKELGDHQLRIRQRNRNLRTRVIEIDNDINKVKWYLNSLKKFEMSPKYRISKALIEKIKSTLKPTLKESTKGSLINLNDLHLDHAIRYKNRKNKQKRNDQIEEEKKEITPVYSVKDKLSEKDKVGWPEEPIETMVTTRRYSKKGGKPGTKSLLEGKISQEMKTLHELEKIAKGGKSSSSLDIDDKINQELQHFKKLKKPRKRRKRSSSLYKEEKSDPNKKFETITKSRRSSPPKVEKLIKSRRQLSKKIKPRRSFKVLKSKAELPSASSDDVFNRLIKDAQVKKSSIQMDDIETKVNFPNKIHKINFKKTKSGEELYANQMKNKKRSKRKVKKKKELQPQIDTMVTGDNENVPRTDSQAKLIDAQEQEKPLQSDQKDIIGTASLKSSIDSRFSFEQRKKMELERQRIEQIRNKAKQIRELSKDSRSSIGKLERIKSERLRMAEIRKNAREMRESDANDLQQKISIDSKSSVGQQARIKSERRRIIRKRSRAAVVDSRGSLDSRGYAAYSDDIWNEMQKSHKEMIGDGATNIVKQKKKQQQKTGQLQEVSKRYLKASKISKASKTSKTSEFESKPFVDSDESLRLFLKKIKDDRPYVKRSHLSFHSKSKRSRPSQGSIATIILDNDLMPRVSYFQDKHSISELPPDAEVHYKTKSEYEDIKTLFDIFMKRKVKLTSSELSVLRRYTYEPKRYNKLLEKMFEDRFTEYQVYFDEDVLEPQFAMLKHRNEMPRPRQYSLTTIKSDYSEFEDEPETMPTTDWTRPEFTKAFWDSYLDSLEKTPFQIELEKDRSRKEKEELKAMKLAKKAEKNLTKKKKSKVRLIQMLYSNPRKTARERRIEEMYKKPREKCRSICPDCCPCCNFPVSQGEQRKDVKSNELSPKCSQCGGFILKSNSNLNLDPTSFKSVCSMCDILSSDCKQPVDIPEIPDIVEYQCKVLRSACDLLTPHSTNRSDDTRYNSINISDDIRYNSIKMSDDIRYNSTNISDDIRYNSSVLRCLPVKS